MKLPEELEKALKALPPHALVAIDGRCGSGKTTLAAAVEDVFRCTTLHMDDYYLPLEKRAINWEHIPAGNMDVVRFLGLIQDLKAYNRGRYVPFSCQKRAYGEGRVVSSASFYLIEGSYALHPLLAEYYDLKVFLTCDPGTQTRRLLAREGKEGLTPFRTRWIPMEERYFAAYHIQETADLVVETA